MNKRILVIFMTLSSLYCGTARAQNNAIPAYLKAAPLTLDGDLSALMVQGIDGFLSENAGSLKEERTAEWEKKSRLQAAAWKEWVETKRSSLRSVLALSAQRESPSMQILTAASLHQYSASSQVANVQPFRMVVLDGLNVEGLLVTPKLGIKARLVLVPDADQRPELLAGVSAGAAGRVRDVAQKLASVGIQVVIPVLVSREQTYSGSEALNIFTNQPHREWLYRQGFSIGRHLIGYEVDKLLSCIDWFENENKRQRLNAPIGVAGYGEGGLLALYAAALDDRVAVSLISGHVGHGDSVWEQPIYRNVQALNKHAGEAELLAMADGKVIVEHANSPVLQPLEVKAERRVVAAPGVIRTPALAGLKEVVQQAVRYKPGREASVKLISDQSNTVKEPFSGPSITSLAKIFGIKNDPAHSTFKPIITTSWIDEEKRQYRTVREMEAVIQRELDDCETARNKGFWSKIKQNPTKDQEVKSALREAFYQVIGKVQKPLLPPSPKARLLEKNDKWNKYEVVLEVWKGVFAWGILVVPTGAEAGGKHPVVVCQHGLEGLPDDMVTRDSSGRKYEVYKSVALTLAERGYVTFSPHNPYRGEHTFRVLQRKANPMGLSLFSVITAQHQQIVNWLGSLSFVDPARIGFYGLSYGGKTAMRVPALVEGYALSICSGDFNEWVRKVSTTRGRFSYQFTKEYEIYEWDLGHTFNYAEMAALIAPRPFMVEYGYYDGIGTAEWIGYEFGKVKKHYVMSGLSENLDIDQFVGVHEIHGTKTYEFLDKHLKPLQTTSSR